jgi:hypothetical protein
MNFRNLGEYLDLVIATRQVSTELLSLLSALNSARMQLKKLSGIYAGSRNFYEIRNPVRGHRSREELARHGRQLRRLITSAFFSSL